jgi:lysophospholipase L1-like esterase
MVGMSTPIRRRTFLGAGVAGLLGVFVAACGGKDDDEDAGGTVDLNDGTMPVGGPAVDLTPTRQTAGRDVVMIGDSITVGATSGLEAAAKDLGVKLTIYAEVGRRITVGRDPIAGVEVLQDVLDDGAPDLFVIALGTNDVGKYASQDEYETQINELLDLIPDTTPVAWINTYLRDDPDDSAQFNAALIAALESRGNATIAKWSNIAAQDGALEDGIHPSDDGRVQFTNLVGTEIANWLD